LLNTRTVMKIFFCFITFWTVSCIIFEINPVVFYTVLVVAILVSYNIGSYPIGKFFRLTKKSNHEYHIQKRIFASLILFSTHSSYTSLLYLYRDLIQNAIPKTLPVLRNDQKLVLTTHFIASKNLPCLPGYKRYSEIIKPSWCSIRMAGICAVLSGLIRKTLARNSPPIPDISAKIWYCITWKKI